MSFISKKMQEYEDGTFRLVRENEDGSGLFIYKGESIILKRCKRGYWKDPATGECVPKEQLRGTEQPKAVEPEVNQGKMRWNPETRRLEREGGSSEKPKEEPKKDEVPKKEPKEEKPKKPKAVVDVPTGSWEETHTKLGEYVDDNIAGHKVIQGKYERYEKAEDLAEALKEGDANYAIVSINDLLSQGPVSRNKGLATNLENLKSEVYQGMKLYDKENPKMSVLGKTFNNNVDKGLGVLNHLISSYDVNLSSNALKDVKKLSNALEHIEDMNKPDDFTNLEKLIWTVFDHYDMKKLYYGQKNEKMKDGFYAIMDIKNSCYDYAREVEDYNRYKKK